MSTLIDIFGTLKSEQTHQSKQPKVMHSYEFANSNDSNHASFIGYNASTPRPDTHKPKGSAYTKSNTTLNKNTLSNTICNSDLSIRFLIFVEDSEGIRSNIFDSNKLPKSSMSHPNYLASISASISNKSTPKSASNSSYASKLNSKNSNSKSKDLNNEMLTRMVFGSFPMVVSNRTAIKVHSLKNSNKTMISNVFVYYNNSNAIYKNQCADCHNLKQQIENKNLFNMNALNTQLTETHKLNSSALEADISSEKKISSKKLIQTANVSNQSNSSIKNTKPIDIVNSSTNLNNLSNRATNSHNNKASKQQSKHRNQFDEEARCSNKKISISLTNSALNQCSNGSTATIFTSMNTTKPLLERTHHHHHHHHHQSSSSSLISSNSSSNLNQTNTACNNRENSFNSSCSSVPTYYGSYSGIYKRLMRSVSNSLISSTNTTIPISSNLNESISDSAELLQSNDFTSPLPEKQRKISSVSNNSFSSCKEPADIHQQASLCEKCIDNNFYPKYKIGLSVLFCLAHESSAKSSLSSTPPSSPPSTSVSPTNNLMLSNNCLKKQQSYDPILLFPSSPPIGTPHSPSTFIQSNTQKNSNATDDDFYKFFFSHLPIIEYQIKELKVKLIENLPLYFNQFQTPAGMSQSFSSNNALSSSSYQRKSTSFNSSMHNFAQKMLKDFEEYEKKFNLLYASPRLETPAWLTIMNNRKLNSVSIPHSIASKNDKASSIGNMIVNELVNISKSIHLNDPNAHSQSNGKRFLTSLRNSLIKEKNSNESSYKETIRSNFMSTVMSTILKHHLSWVYTVLPSNELNTSKTNLLLRKQRVHWTSILEKTNPYNPLWAQLGDLHGAVNHPLKLVRTVVLGKNRELVEQLLFIISYFIRCGNSSYYDINPENFDFEKLSQQTSSSTSSSSTSSLPSASHNTNLDTTQQANSDTKACTESTHLQMNAEKTLKYPHNEYDEENDQLAELSEENTTNSFLINDEASKSNKLNSSTNADANQSREVNIFELSIDPLSQFNALIASASAKCSASSNSNSKQSTQKPHRCNADELSYISSLSSSSSMTSPSSCSISSSPLNSNLKYNNNNNNNNNKKNCSSTLSELNNPIRNAALANQAARNSLASTKLPAATSANAALCKKKRNLSSNSNGENCTAQELPLIGGELTPNHSKSTRMQDNFGYSLLASYCDEFVFEFVLHGTADRSFLDNLHERLVFSKQNSIIDCPIEESIYIVVDVDEFDVRVFSSEQTKNDKNELPASEKSIDLIDSLAKSVLNMFNLFKNSEFILLHLEDKLQEFCTKAITLNQLKSQSDQIDEESLLKLMELNDYADLDFLNRILKAIELPNLC